MSNDWQDKYRPRAKGGVAAGAYEFLRDCILHKQIPPGVRLPAERLLAERLDVNRNAVREALKRLEQARLISVQRGGGSTVLNFLRFGGLDLFRDLLITDRGSTNWQTVLGLMEFRAAVTGPVASTCAERMTEEDVEELRSLLNNLEAAETQTLKLVAFSRFWAHLANCTRNIVFRLAYNSITTDRPEHVDIMLQAYCVELELTDHLHMLVEAIATGKQEIAAQRATDMAHAGLEHVRALAEDAGHDTEATNERVAQDALGTLLRHQ